MITLHSSLGLRFVQKNVVLSADPRLNNVVKIFLKQFVIPRLSSYEQYRLMIGGPSYRAMLRWHMSSFQAASTLGVP